MAVPEGTTLATIESLSGDETVATGRHGASPEAEAGGTLAVDPAGCALIVWRRKSPVNWWRAGSPFRPTLPARNESTGVGREDAR